MIKQQNSKFYVSTKVKGVSGAKVPGEYFGYQGKAMARIKAQPLIREMAMYPEMIDAVLVSSMVVKVVIGGEEHPVGVLDRKYYELAKNRVINVRNFEITGFDASLEKEYMKLGINITFEITEDEAKHYLKTHYREALVTA